MFLTKLKKKKIISFYATFQCGRYNLFKKDLNLCFALKKLKKTPSKVAQNNSNPLFPYCLSCPNGPNRRIHAPKCGLQTNCIQNQGLYLAECCTAKAALLFLPEVEIFVNFATYCSIHFLVNHEIDTQWKKVESKEKQVSLIFPRHVSLS